MTAPMPIKAVLFDFDGTLVDSARDLAETLNRLLAEEGVAALSLEAVKDMIGDGVGKLVERGLSAVGADPSRAPALTPRFLQLYEEHAARHTRPYPGVAEALEQLRHRGLRLGVVTNKPTGPTLEILKAFALARFFDAVVCGDTLPKRKPDPAPLLVAAARLEIAPAETIMVGDNYHDVAAARAAAMRVMIVTWGYLRGCSEKLGVDCILQSFADLPQAIAALGRRAPRDSVLRT